MNVLVFGGRKYNDWHKVWKVLDDLHHRYTISLIIHGNASGADSWGKQWAIRRGVEHTGSTFAADWSDISHPDALIKTGQHGTYDARAGFRRNQRMIDENWIDLAVMFPGNNGTKDMLQRVKMAGIKLMEVQP